MEKSNPGKNPKYFETRPNNRGVFKKIRGGPVGCQKNHQRRCLSQNKVKNKERESQKRREIENQTKDANLENQIRV